MKTAKRKVSLLLAVLLLTASLSACRRERQDAGEETLSDDLYSYRISIDGHVYSLPCPVSEFDANGWEICSSQEPAAESIAPGESDGYDCVMEGKTRMEIELYNAHAEKAAPSDCTVVAVRVQAGNGIETVLPGDLPLDSDLTEEKLFRVYGRPEKTLESSHVFHYYYRLTYRKMIEFVLSDPGKGASPSDNCVFLANREVPDDQAVLYRSALPKADIPDKLESGQVCIDGHVYADPFDFSEFMENGWSVSDSYPAESVEPNTTRNWIWFVKDDKKTEVTVYNPSGKEKPVQDCLIVKVRLELVYGMKYYILPGNFIFDQFTSVQDIIDQYGQPDQRDEKDAYTEMTYSSDDNGAYSVVFEIARENTPYPPTFSAITLTRNVEGGEDHD